MYEDDIEVDEVMQSEFNSKKTYKDKFKYLRCVNFVRKMNALYFAKVFAFTMIGVLTIFHLISVTRVCMFISKSPKEFQKTITKEQMCKNNKYDC